MEVADKVEITFRAMTPSDEIVYFVRRLCRRVDEQEEREGEWKVVLSREERRDRIDVRIVRVDDLGREEASESDPDPFLGIRNAFLLLAVKCGRRARNLELLDSGVHAPVDLDAERAASPPKSKN